MKTRNIVIVLIAITLLSLGGWWLSVRSVSAANSTTNIATGVFETRQVTLASEIGGKISEVLIEEGQRVEANQPLVRLDDSLLQKQREQAQSEVDAVQANLRLLEAGATQDQMDAAQAQLSLAEASLHLAQAALDNASAGTRPEDIATFSIKLDQARVHYYTMTIALTNDQLNELESAFTQAKNNLVDAIRRRDALKNNGSALDYVISFAEASVTDTKSAQETTQQAYDAAQDETMPYYRQIELARITWQLAQLNEAQAQARLDGLRSDSKVPTDLEEMADATLENAKDLVDATKSAYDELTTGASAKRLDSAWDEVEKAQKQLASIVRAAGGSAEILLAQVDAATAQRDLAAANLSALKYGARNEEIEAARAQVEIAQAQLDALDIQLKKLTITAPWDGVVLTRSAEVGGTALPGATLIEIGRLDQLELTVYLPEEKFGLIAPSQAVQVRVDAYPDRVFEGTVARVADEAEFTPTNVQTKEDRTRLVYAVVIGLDNANLLLKSGMIADVVFIRE